MGLQYRLIDLLSRRRYNVYFRGEWELENISYRILTLVDIRGNSLGETLVVL